MYTDEKEAGGIEKEKEREEDKRRKRKGSRQTWMGRIELSIVLKAMIDPSPAPTTRSGSSKVSVIRKRISKTKRYEINSS